MTAPLGLRAYQQEMIDGLYADYGRGVRRAAGVMATGGGKTHVFARVIADAVAAGRKAVVLAHRTELIDQAAARLRSVTEGLDVGVLQATRRQTGRAVTVASVQTAVRPAALRLLRAHRPGLVVVDECHRIAAPSYQTVLRELGCFEPDGPLLYGVTATLGRADGLALGDTFESVSCTIGMDRLVREGYLLPPKGVRVKVEGLDLSRIRTSRTSESGLDDKAVAAAMHESLAPAAIARAMLEHCKGRAGVAFFPSVEFSKECAQVFSEHGLRAVHVDAGTPRWARDEIMRRARLGEYDVVCNVGLFTEGTDVPIWSFVVLGRPTSSENLFMQMIGRGARVHPGQRDYVVLDVVGATGRHRIRSIVRLDGVQMLDELDEELEQFEEDDSDEQDDEEAGPSAGWSEPEGADGPLVHELVDLFSASHTAWQRSPRGVWYLPTGDAGAVFLAPNDPAQPDSYDVRAAPGGELLHEDPCDLLAAMAWGDKIARERAKVDLDRAAEWRGKRLTAMERRMAIYRGEAPGGEAVPRTAGALAEARDARWAAATIDALPCVAGVSPSGYWTT